MDNKTKGYPRWHMPAAIRTNDITALQGSITKEIWKRDDEEFNGEDYEPIFTEHFTYQPYQSKNDEDLPF